MVSSLKTINESRDPDVDRRTANESLVNSIVSLIAAACDASFAQKETPSQKVVSILVDN